MSEAIVPFQAPKDFSAVFLIAGCLLSMVTFLLLGSFYKCPSFDILSLVGVIFASNPNLSSLFLNQKSYTIIEVAPVKVFILC